MIDNGKLNQKIDQRLQTIVQADKKDSKPVVV